MLASSPHRSDTGIWEHHLKPGILREPGQGGLCKWWGRTVKVRGGISLAHCCQEDHQQVPTGLVKPIAAIAVTA